MMKAQIAVSFYRPADYRKKKDRQRRVAGVITGDNCAAEMRDGLRNPMVAAASIAITWRQR